MLHDPDAMERLLLDLSVNVTAMFRDPSFYKAFRERSSRCCAPIRSSGSGTPAVRPGRRCTRWRSSSRRRGCYDRARIYATDINDVVLQQARQRDLSARPDAGVHGELLAPAARGRSPSTTRRSTTARCSIRALHAERRVLAAQPRHGPVVQRVQRDLLPQRADLLRPDAAEPRARAVLRQPRDASAILALGSKESLQVLAVRACYEKLSPTREDLPEGAMMAIAPGIGYDRRRRHVVGRARRASHARRRPAARPSTMPVVARPAPAQGLRRAAAARCCRSARRCACARSRTRCRSSRARLRRAAGLPPARSSRATSRSSTEAPVRYSRPSIDVTFASAADSVRAPHRRRRAHRRERRRRGGLRRIAERGGLAIVQDPATAESRPMPEAALKAVPRGARADARARSPRSSRRCRPLPERATA